MLRDRGVNARLAWCLNSVLNVKALVGTFNQVKSLEGAFSVIVKTDCETDGLSSALQQREKQYCSEFTLSNTFNQVVQHPKQKL